MLSIKINGWDTLADSLSKYTETVKAGVANAIQETANNIVESAQKNAPGALADSISADIADDGLSATITANSEYAVYAEYGVNIPEIKAHNAKALHFVKDGEDVFGRSAKAHKIEPKPFMNPAFEENAQGLIDNLNKTLEG